MSKVAPIEDLLEWWDMSRKDLAALCWVDQRTIYRWKTGDAAPKGPAEGIVAALVNIMERGKNPALVDREAARRLVLHYAHSGGIYALVTESLAVEPTTEDEG